MACLHRKFGLFTNEFESIFDNVKFLTLQKPKYLRSLVSIYTYPILLAVSSQQSIYKACQLGRKKINDLLSKIEYRLAGETLQTVQVKEFQCTFYIIHDKRTKFAVMCRYS